MLVNFADPLGHGIAAHGPVKLASAMPPSWKRPTSPRTATPKPGRPCSVLFAGLRRILLLQCPVDAVQQVILLEGFDEVGIRASLKLRASVRCRRRRR